MTKVLQRTWIAIWQDASSEDFVFLRKIKRFLLFYCPKDSYGEGVQMGLSGLFVSQKFHKVPLFTQMTSVFSKITEGGKKVSKSPYFQSRF